MAARYVSEGLRQSESDTICEVRTRLGGRLYVYLMLKFQSSPDWTMPLRIASYVGQFYRGLLVWPDIRKPWRLPQVLQIVIYSGKGAWSTVEEVHEPTDRRDSAGHWRTWPTRCYGCSCSVRRRWRREAE